MYKPYPETRIDSFWKQSTHAYLYKAYSYALSLIYYIPYRISYIVVSAPIGLVNRNQTQITISNCCRSNWAATTVAKLSMVMGVGTRYLRCAR